MTTPAEDKLAHKLDMLAIYLTAFASQNDPKLIHDEIVHKVTALLLAQQQSLLESLLKEQFWAADDAYDAGQVVSVDVIEKELQNIKGELGEVK